MPGIFASYPIEGGGGSTVSSLNGLTGALTLVAGTGITITPSGSNITIAASGSSGANQSLSNLNSPTAINQALTFGAGIAGSLTTSNNGAGTSQSLAIAAGSATTTAGALTLAGGAGTATNAHPGLVQVSGGASQGNQAGGAASLNGGNSSSSGAGGAASINGGNAGTTGAGGAVNIIGGTGGATAGHGGNLSITGGTSQSSGGGGTITVAAGTNNSTGPGGNLFLLSGTSTSGNGGNINIVTGNGAGGSTRGALLLSDGSEGAGSPGWVLTLVDTSGTATWMPASGGGANQSLSNLNSPTAINAAAFTFSVDPTITSPSVLTFLTSAMAIQGLSSLPATLELYDDTGNQFVGFKSSTGLASSTTWALPSADGTNGQALTTDGSAGLFFSSFANATLSNLTAPTEISVNLQPSSNQNFDLGTVGLLWGTVWASAFSSSTGSFNIVANDVPYVWPSADATTPNQAMVSDAGGNLSFFAGASGTFTTVDLKTVTVVNGLITSIV